MTTLNSTSVLASIIAQNPYHIISIQGQMPMSHAQNTYDFEIAEDDPHYEEISDYSLEMLWVYTYADKESLELDLMEILNQMDLLRGCDDQYYKDNFNEEEHAEEIEYYLNFLEKPETLYTFTENTINFFKSLIK